MWVAAVVRSNLSMDDLEQPVQQTQQGKYMIKGELNPKIDFSKFDHLGIVEHLYERWLNK